MIEAQLGAIDVWVNNAMTTVFAFFDDIAPREYERATRVTYLGTVWGTRVALERMLPRNSGTIVQVGSDHDEGAHGVFDDQAHPRSAQAWVTRHRSATALGAGLLGAAAAATVARRLA